MSCNCHVRLGGPRQPHYPILTRSCKSLCICCRPIYIVLRHTFPLNERDNDRSETVLALTSGKMLVLELEPSLHLSELMSEPALVPQLEPTSAPQLVQLSHLSGRVSEMLLAPQLEQLLHLSGPMSEPTLAPQLEQLLQRSAPMSDVVLAPPLEQLLHLSGPMSETSLASKLELMLL